jgi:hypothetical protein
VPQKHGLQNDTALGECMAIASAPRERLTRQYRGHKAFSFSLFEKMTVLYCT